MENIVTMSETSNNTSRGMANNSHSSEGENNIVYTSEELNNTILFEIHGINHTAYRICWMYNYLRTKYRKKNILLIEQNSSLNSFNIVKYLQKNFEDVLIRYDKDRKDYRDILLVVIIGTCELLNIITQSSGGENIITQSSGGENIITQSSGGENIITQSSGGENIIFSESEELNNICIIEGDKSTKELIRNFHHISSIYFHETYILKEKPDFIPLVNIGDHQWIVTIGGNRYNNTYIWNSYIAEIFQKRFQTISHKRRIMEFKPSDNYKFKEYRNKTLHVRSCSGFDKTHFDMKLWSFTDNQVDKVYKSQVPHIVLCYEWCNSWQHIVQDLLPVLVSIKEYLDTHPDYKIIIIINNNLMDMIQNILQIKNEFICVNRNNSFENLTNVYLVCESDEEPQNTISNIRDNKYYKNINNLTIKYLHRIYPDIDNKDISSRNNNDKYILYLGRTQEKRRLSNFKEILSLYPDIRVFDLGIKNMPLVERFKMFYEASLIIIPHGGSAYNIIACKPGTPVIEIYSAHNHINVANIANGIGLKYFPVITHKIYDHFQDEYILESENIQYIREIITKCFS
jgi:hypothetical protein